jgi:hypothetical protein
MSVYTVLEPSIRNARARLQPDQFVFVRDGFHGWAFLLTPLWMLWHRLWLVLLLYLVLMIGVEAGLWAIGASAGVKAVIGLLVSLLAGLEAATLRRWTLERHGWSTVGVVVDEDQETAERRFFDAWGERADRPLTPPVATPDYRPPSDPHPPVIGLFPEPGVQR